MLMTYDCNDNDNDDYNGGNDSGNNTVLYKLRLLL